MAAHFYRKLDLKPVNSWRSNRSCCLCVLQQRLSEHSPPLIRAKHAARQAPVRPNFETGDLLSSIFRVMQSLNLGPAEVIRACSAPNLGRRTCSTSAGKLLCAMEEVQLDNHSDTSAQVSSIGTEGAHKERFPGLAANDGVMSGSLHDHHHWGDLPRFPGEKSMTSSVGVERDDRSTDDEAAVEVGEGAACNPFEPLGG